MACPAGDVGEEVAVWPNHGGRVSAASVPLASLKGHSSPVTAIRYGNCSHGHDDQEKMASASDDALLVWTLPGGGCIRVRSNCVLLTFVLIFFILFLKNGGTLEHTKSISPCASPPPPPPPPHSLNAG